MCVCFKLHSALELPISSSTSNYSIKCTHLVALQVPIVDVICFGVSIRQNSGPELAVLDG